MASPFKISPLQHVNFQKFSERACHQTLQELSWFLNHFQIYSAEKQRFKEIWKLWLPPFKIFQLQHVNFQKFSKRACHQTLQELFLFLNHFQIRSAEKKKRFKEIWKLWLPPVGRRLEKNYSFCEPCFLSLFRP